MAFVVATSSMSGVASTLVVREHAVRLQLGQCAPELLRGVLPGMFVQPPVFASAGRRLKGGFGRLAPEGPISLLRGNAVYAPGNAASTAAQCIDPAQDPERGCRLCSTLPSLSTGLPNREVYRAVSKCRPVPFVCPLGVTVRGVSRLRLTCAVRMETKARDSRSALAEDKLAGIEGATCRRTCVPSGACAWRVHAGCRLPGHRRPDGRRLQGGRQHDSGQDPRRDPPQALHEERLHARAGGART